MSSSATVRTTVLRGAAAARIPGVALDADLSLLRPLTPRMPATAADAEAAAAQIRAEASRVGYEDGFTAGQTAGHQAATAQTAETMARLESAIAAVTAATEGLATRQASAIADVEQHIATLAVSIAEAILGRELAAADAPARDALVHALRLAPKRVDVIAHVNPVDEATLGDVAGLAADRSITVVADPSIEPGGCVVQAGPCSIDAQITPALQRVREALGA